MMKVSGQATQLKELINQAKHITLLTYVDPKPEIMNNVFVWKNTLRRRNKDITIIAPGWSGDESKKEEVDTALPPRRTTIKVGLNDQQVKKISYELKDGFLYLYLTPEKGTITGEQVEIASDRLNTNLVITFGIRGAHDLTDWPATWPNDLKSYAPIINIDISTNNQQYGSINVIEPDYISISHLTFDLLKTLSFECDKISAGLLLDGIKHATRNFTNNVSAQLFEVAAELMRLIENGKSDEIAKE